MSGITGLLGQLCMLGIALRLAVVRGLCQAGGFRSRTVGPTGRARPPHPCAKEGGALDGPRDGPLVAVAKLPARSAPRDDRAGASRLWPEEPTAPSPRYGVLGGRPVGVPMADSHDAADE